MLSVILEETFIPLKYKRTFKYLLSLKIRRIIKKVDKETKPVDVDVEN